MRTTISGRPGDRISTLDVRRLDTFRAWHPETRDCSHVGIDLRLGEGRIVVRLDPMTAAKLATDIEADLVRLAEERRARR